MLPIFVATFLGAWGLPPPLPEAKQAGAIVAPAPRNRTETQGTPNQQQNESPSVSPTPSPASRVGTPAPQKETRQANEEPSQIWIQSGSKEYDWSGLALVVVAAAGVGCALWTLRALREQIADGKIVAQAAKDNADALKVINRARIQVKSLNFSNVESADSKTFHWSYVVENEGPTTGHVFETQLCSVVSTNPLPQDPPYQGVKAKPCNISIGPKQRITFTSDQIDKGPKFGAVSTGSATVHALGYISYRDEFGDVHQVGYGYRYYANALPGIVTKPGYNYAN
jgi:hypothetical protein